MSDKRPETSADIVTRSRVLKGRPSHAPRPGRKPYSVDLKTHMAECDANYARLLHLFPALRDGEQMNMTLALNNFSTRVLFEVLEQGPYTTLLKVSTDSGQQWLGRAVTPEFTLRVYHDARSAEVVSYQNQNRFHGKYDYPNQRMRQRDEKVQINRFLSEFLSLCISHGASAEQIF